MRNLTSIDVMKMQVRFSEQVSIYHDIISVARGVYVPSRDAAAMRYGVSADGFRGSWPMYIDDDINGCGTQTLLT